MSSNRPYDIFVIGGGVNGCGVARDAAGRGYSVCLAEMNDLASGTSSGSTKLIHGGLRYLEHLEFRLVREALRERETLWRNAPHIIRPLRFVLPHRAGLRPAWMLRLGLFLYDHLGGRDLLPPSRRLDMRSDEAAQALQPLFRTGFEYADCWVDDARLTILNARDAADRGARIRTRCKVTGAKRRDGLWSVTLQPPGQPAEHVRARLLVNAAGPWMDETLGRIEGRRGGDRLRLVQGSHIVVRRLFEHDRCYIFQNPDGRIIFAIPYEGAFTLIGTTDRDYTGDPAKVTATRQEIDYLCAAANAYFATPVSPADVVWSYAAIRPLYDDGAGKAQEATRDYVLKVEAEVGAAPLVNVFGGKITTYRRLAESVLAHVEPALGAKGPAWTEAAPLPGGNFHPFAFADKLDELKRTYPFLNESHALRLMRGYGLDSFDLLDKAAGTKDLGQHFGDDLWEAEIRYLIEREWAATAEDILWRRSKLGLRLTADQTEALERYLKQA